MILQAAGRSVLLFCGPPRCDVGKPPSPCRLCKLNASLELTLSDCQRARVCSCKTTWPKTAHIWQAFARVRCSHSVLRVFVCPSNGLHRLSAALERTPQKNTFKRAARVYPAAMAGDSLPPYEGRLCGMLAGVLQHALKAYLRPSQTHQ